MAAVTTGWKAAALISACWQPSTIRLRRTVPHARFRAEEDAQGYFLLLEGTIQSKGVPLALCSDRHGIFQRTYTESALGGYEVTNFPLEIAPLNRELRSWERTYNTVRPHQALKYLTPWAFWQR